MREHQLTDDDWWRIQVTLHELGLYAGPRDGKPSPRTEAAIRAFQGVVDHLEPHGVVEEYTWGALQSAAQAVWDVAVGADDDPATWDPIPGALLQRALDFPRACVAAGCRYSPGRAHADSETRRFTMTPGAFGIGRVSPKVKGGGWAPGWVCSTYTYALGMVLCGHLHQYQEGIAGGQPPIWTVLRAPAQIHKGGRFGPWHGLGPYFRPLLSDGSTSGRHKRAKAHDCDLLELWDRFESDPLSVPEVMLGAWASSRRGFYHHTMAVVFDRERREMHVSHAAGWRSKGGVFSGTPFSLTTVATRLEAEPMSTRGWGQWYGLVPSSELLQQCAEAEWEWCAEVRHGVVQPIDFKRGVER